MFLFLLPVTFLNAQTCDYFSGDVTGYSWNLTPCQRPYTDLDIVEAEVEVAGVNSNGVCSYLSDLDGMYYCQICDPDRAAEYTICVKTRCDAKCGDTSGWGDDANTDGVVLAVDDKDRVKIEEFINGSVIPSLGQFLSADINGDGVLDADDLDCFDETVPGCPTSWCRFIPKSEVMDVSINFDGTLHNPNNHDLDNCITLSAAEATTDAVDFYRFNVGDVVSPFCRDCVHGEWGQYPLLYDPDRYGEAVTTKEIESEIVDQIIDTEKSNKNSSIKIRLNHYAPVDIPANSKEVITQFYELGGKLVMENKYTLAEGKNTFNVGTHHLPAGIYIIKYITETDMQSQKVLIK